MVMKRFWVSAAAASSTPRPMNSRSIGVLVSPGQTTLTRIWSGAKRRARDFVRPTTPNLPAEYKGLSCEPTRPETDAVKMIEPLPRLRICLAAAPAE